jgi:hypothetical protein
MPHIFVCNTDNSCVSVDEFSLVGTMFKQFEQGFEAHLPSHVNCL